MPRHPNMPKLAASALGWSGYIVIFKIVQNERSINPLGKKMFYPQFNTQDLKLLTSSQIAGRFDRQYH